MTRLAADSDAHFAATTYRALLSHQETQMRKVRSQFDFFHPYWAVAESSACGLPQWQAFPTLDQGDGDLGLRMSRICDQLWSRHPFYAITGADCPQFPYALISSIYEYLSTPCEDGSSDHGSCNRRAVVCPSNDGGFVFFGANFEFTEPWQRMSYSNSTTCDQLFEELRGTTVWKMESLVDIDYLQDMSLALEEAENLRQPETQDLLFDLSALVPQSM